MGGVLSSSTEINKFKFTPDGVGEFFLKIDVKGKSGGNYQLYSHTIDLEARSSL